MRSSADDSVAQALHAAADAVLDAARARGVQHPVIVIDGRSGAGKTTLAALIAQRWAVDATPMVLALDSVYPGWDGLAAGARHVYEQVLIPRAAGRDGTWTAWDWQADAPAETHTVPAAMPLIVEGCGILTPESHALVDVSVWVHAPAAERRTRALARDGESYRPHWERWAAQEDAHIARHKPESIADIVVRVP